MKQLVTTEWLEKNINKVKILDATWCLPNSGRNAEEEFKENHIKNSIFFDIDKNSKQNSSLPHMLPSNKEWGNIVSDLGINNSDHVIIYDNSDVFSSITDLPLDRLVRLLRTSSPNALYTFKLT